MPQVVLDTCLSPNLRYIVTHNGTMDMVGSESSVEEIEVPGNVYQVAPPGHFRIGETYWLGVTPYNRFGAGPSTPIIFSKL